MGHPCTYTTKAADALMHRRSSCSQVNDALQPLPLSGCYASEQQCFECMSVVQQKTSIKSITKALAAGVEDDSKRTACERMRNSPGTQGAVTLVTRDIRQPILRRGPVAQVPLCILSWSGYLCGLILGS